MVSWCQRATSTPFVNSHNVSGSSPMRAVTTATIAAESAYWGNKNPVKLLAR